MKLPLITFDLGIIFGLGITTRLFWIENFKALFKIHLQIIINEMHTDFISCESCLRRSLEICLVSRLVEDMSKNNETSRKRFTARILHFRCKVTEEGSKLVH